MIFISWSPIITGRNPLAPPLLREVSALQTTALWQALQDQAHWSEAVKQLVTMWVGEAPTSEAAQIWEETGTHGHEMWSRAGREISAVFARKTDPVQAFGTFNPACPCSTCTHNPMRPNSSRHRSRLLGIILGLLCGV
jgi:hypothetical protein